MEGEVDVADVRKFLCEFTLEKCKIVLLGNEKIPEPNKQPTASKVDIYFGTRYDIYDRPTAEEIQKTLSDNQCQGAIESLKTNIIKKNKYVPENTKLVTKPR